MLTQFTAVSESGKTYQVNNLAETLTITEPEASGDSRLSTDGPQVLPIAGVFGMPIIGEKLFIRVTDIGDGHPSIMVTLPIVEIRDEMYAS